MSVKFCKRKPLFFTCGGSPYYYVPKEERYYSLRGALYAQKNEGYWERLTYRETIANVELSIKGGSYKLTERNKEDFIPFTPENIRKP